jgi:hypothetical protein
MSLTAKEIASQDQEELDFDYVKDGDLFFITYGGMFFKYASRNSTEEDVKEEVAELNGE